MSSWTRSSVQPQFVFGCLHGGGERGPPPVFRHEAQRRPIPCGTPAQRSEQCPCGSGSGSNAPRWVRRRGTWLSSRRSNSSAAARCGQLTCASSVGWPRSGRTRVRRMSPRDRRARRTLINAAPQPIIISRPSARPPGPGRLPFAAAGLGGGQLGLLTTLPARSSSSLEIPSAGIGSLMTPSTPPVRGIVQVPRSLSGGTFGRWLTAGFDVVKDGTGHDVDGRGDSRCQPCVARGFGADLAAHRPDDPVIGDPVSGPAALARVVHGRS